MHLPIDSLPPELAGLRIIHLTDFHIRRTWFGAYDHILESIRANPPDLILLTGDYVEHRRLIAREVEHARRFLDSLEAPLGIFGIWGNHDGDFLSAQLDSKKMREIENTVVTLRSASGASVELIGLPGVNRDDLDRQFLANVRPRAERGLRIALAHYPDDIVRIESLHTDIMLAGHTHGGQINLPGGFAPITHDSLPRKFAKGVHRWRNTWLIVARGIGYAGIPVRAFCSSEVVELVLQPVAPTFLSVSDAGTPASDSGR